MCVCVCVCVCVTHIVTCIITQARGTLDEDGFFDAELYGRVGLVPSNLVELITDPAILATIETTIAELAKTRQGK